MYEISNSFRVLTHSLHWSASVRPASVLFNRCTDEDDMSALSHLVSFGASRRPPAHLSFRRAVSRSTSAATSCRHRDTKVNFYIYTFID